MQFRVLGRVDADHHGSPVPLGRRRERCLLGVLLLDAGVPVAADRLAALLWDDEPPTTARAALNTHVSRLRNRLDPHNDGSLGVRLVNRHGGYLAEVDPQTVDASRFRALYERARTMTDPAERSACLREALALWRGPVLADVASPRLRERVGAELTELRMSAIELMVDAELACGRHQQLVGELSTLTAEHPYRERLAGQLMLALYRCDRYAEALTAYHRLRDRLAGELGVDPGPELSDLYTAILRRDPQLAGSGTTRMVPAQLPAAPPWFTGRVSELAVLTKTLTDAVDRGGTVVISAIGGAGGIGKTWLALGWAYQRLDRFPDGQLFVNLRGFDPSRQPMSPATAVRGFLDALGVAPAAIPMDPDAQTGLYRSLVAGRRMLIVLDNARDTSQVADLLPGSAACTVIVTSRDRLTGLVGRHGAHSLPLDVLDEAEARELLARRLGEDRLAGEPEAVAALVAGCGGWPLALAIAAARAVIQPDLPLAVIAAELCDATTRLGALAEDDLQASLRAVLSWSYAALVPQQARVFALLAVAAGPDIGLSAAAALTGLSIAEVAAALRALERQSLLQQHTPGRWRMHDLVRLYAAERADAEVAEPDRHAALTRLFVHYAGTASAATRLLYPHDPTPEPTPPPTTDVRFADQAQAAAWLDVELPNLVATAAHAAQHGWPAHPIHLSRTLWRHLAERSHFATAFALHGHALQAARLTADPAGQAQALVDLGTVHGQLGHYEQAIDHLQQALPLYRVAGDQAGEIRTLSNLGVVHERLGDYEQAIDHLQRALALHHRAGNRGSEATALLNLGVAYGRLGRYDEALDHLQQALALHRQVGNRGSQARALANLGIAYGRLGRHDEALDHHQQALALFRELGNRGQQGDPLNEIGNLLRQRGEHDRALDHHQQALALFRELGDRGGESEVLNDLGLTLRAAGRPGDALDRHRESLPIAEQNHDRYEQARALDGIAHTCRDLDNPDQARQHWRQALEIFTDLDAPEADEVRTRLAALEA